MKKPSQSMRLNQPIHILPLFSCFKQQWRNYVPEHRSP